MQNSGTSDDPIRAYSGRPQGSGLGSVSVYGRDGPDVLGRDLQEVEDDPSEDNFDRYEGPSTSGEQLLGEADPLARGTSASLAPPPPPHLTPTLGGDIPSPEPINQYSGSVRNISNE